MSKRRDTNWLIKKSRSLFGDSFEYENSFYVNAKTKIKFKCKKHDYLFEQTSNNHFNSKHPCKYCLKDARKETLSDSLEDFKQKINSLYGDTFTFENAHYTNQRTPISLTCSKHKKIITKEPQVFLRGHGCDFCSHEELAEKLSSKTLIEINQFVSKLSGKCLSQSYINNAAKLKFQCASGHEFKRSWSEIKNSLRWCPKCSPNKLVGESLARLILEHLLEIKLPSMYIEKMNGLQLDGYNSDRNLAFEYQGYQHFTRGSHFHEEDDRYEAQIQRDILKKNLCAKHGITLIEIFEFKTIRLGRINLFIKQIKEQLVVLNLKYNNEPFEIDLVELYRGRESTLYQAAKEAVEEKRGCLQKFIGSNSKHTYTCVNGHEIKNRTLGVIINTKASCPYCDADVRFSQLKNIIESKGGRILAKKLKPKGLSENYKWICNEGHKLESKGQALYDGFWCVKCQREKKKVKLSEEEIVEFKTDVTSGKYYQKDLPLKYGIGATAFRRILKELKLNPKYLPQDRQAQTKRTKGKLLQIDPNDFRVIKKFESLESVKYDESGLFKPEGIRQQMKKHKKAYGYFWCREADYDESIKMMNLNTASNS